MKRFDSRLIWGLLLVVAGALLLLQNLNVLSFVWESVWAVLFAVSGVVFLAVFLAPGDRWWAVIPGFTLLGLAALMLMNSWFPRLGDAWGGTLFLGTMGLSFWIVYLRNREHWWAVIPGGVLWTAAVVAGTSGFLPELSGGLFFFGLAATFLLLYLVPTPEGRMKWAIIPAAVLSVIGLVVMIASSALIQYAWGSALVLLGGYLLYRTLRRK